MDLSQLTDEELATRLDDLHRGMIDAPASDIRATEREYERRHNGHNGWFTAYKNAADKDVGLMVMALWANIKTGRMSPDERRAAAGVVAMIMMTPPKPELGPDGWELPERIPTLPEYLEHRAAIWRTVRGVTILAWNLRRPSALRRAVEEWYKEITGGLRRPDMDMDPGDDVARHRADWARYIDAARELGYDRATWWNPWRE